MAKFKEDTKTKGIKAPAAQRCNRQDPRSPHQRKLRRKTEALARQTSYARLTAYERSARQRQYNETH